MKTCCCECKALKTGRGGPESCRWFNYQQPDRRLFTNTWVGGSRVSLSYLCLRWTIAILILFFLFQPLLSRVIHAPRTSWQYLLYLAHWVRLLAFLHHTTEAVLVSLRYRAELQGQEDIRSNPGYSSGPSSPSLPWTHKMLWTFANISSEVSVLCTLVYWPFIYRPEVLSSITSLYHIVYVDDSCFWNTDQNLITKKFQFVVSRAFSWSCSPQSPTDINKLAN